MRWREIRLALILTFTTGIVFAQSPAEFGRASGGQLDLTFKTPTRWSGSLGLTTGRSTFGTLGGTLVKDRVWFFASAERSRLTPRIDRSIATTVHAPDSVRSFLSLRTTGVSGNSFFTATVSSGQK